MNHELGAEFSIAAAVRDPALRQKLIDLAAIGNDSVSSPYVAPAAMGESSEKRRNSERFLDDLMRVNEFSEEQRRLADKLDRLEDAALRAYDRNTEALGRAQDALALALQNAYQLTLPDGAQIPVFQDGDVVRTETGDIVDPELLDGENIGSGHTGWNERNTLQNDVERLETERSEIEDFLDTIDETREFLDTNPSDGVIADLEAGLSMMPPAVAAEYVERDAPSAAEPAPVADDQSPAISASPSFGPGTP